jgi:hypothetical protein
MIVKKSSFRLECWRFLIVEIFSACFKLVSLLLLRGPSCKLDFSQLSFVLTVGNHLLTAKSFLLLGPKALCLLVGLPCHFCFSKLHLSFIHDLLSLFSVETFEVVRLDAMRSKHGLCSRWVFCHKVMIIGEVDVGLGL